MSEKLLFVDDEPAVLEGYKRMLHREFEVDAAVGGEKGLAVIAEHGPYAVVVSDMRMPGMDGVQFLAKVRQTAPETVRMVLTGHSDINAAMDAVNEGYIFRFLTKPCDKTVLAKAITTALVQYRLVTAEKELLENTLMGSIKILADVLSLVNPAAFSRSLRITRYIRHLVRKLQVDAPWRFEVAAMLSQLGCVALEPEIIEASYLGNCLSPEDQARFDAHPQVARDLLVNIPRLEPTAWMISQQKMNATETKPSPAASLHPEVIVLGANMLKVAIAFDDLKMRGLHEPEILAQLRSSPTKFDRKIVDAIEDMKPEGEKMELRTVPIVELKTGMILQQEVRTQSGFLLAAKGQEVSYPLLVRLNNFQHRQHIPDTVMALVPA